MAPPSQAPPAAWQCIEALPVGVARQRFARLVALANQRTARQGFLSRDGGDLDSRPDCSASRWVINIHDWPEERASEQDGGAVSPELDPCCDHP